VSTKRKYIESHWGVFFLKGIVSLLAGFYMMFTTRQNVDFLIQVIGWTMFALAVVEILNVTHRGRRQNNLGFSLTLSIIEIAISVALLFTVGPNTDPSGLLAVRLSLLAIYVLSTSVITIIMGFKSFNNLTDRFMWVVNGMLGCVLGFVLYPSGDISDIAHVMVFGTYLLVNGLTDLFYGIHSKDSLAELHAERAHKRASKKGDKK